MNELKKLMSLIVILVIVLNLASCRIVLESEPEQEHEYVMPGSKKEILPLQFMPVFDEELEPDPPQYEEISLNCPELPEISQTCFGLDMGLDMFEDYIWERFGIYLDANWKVLVHYYNGMQTEGIAEFKYTIGEIDTNRCVIFWLENGKAVRVCYRNLDGTANESGLLDRVVLFKQRYEQERPSLGEDEHLEEERFSYTYYYSTDKLVYCYNAFFSYGEYGVINNDWGTQCFISEEGKAVFFRMESAQNT